MIDAVHVFVGPTLAPEDFDLLPSAVFHPPVVQGDVYQLVETRPLAIGIVDGYFERAPAVWHKEILWALSEGVHVFGSASMGALRAMELARFGMVGIGQIYEDFESGVLTDDDEVTLIHTEKEHGYRHGSEPMVNIRATLAAAVRDGVVSQRTSDALIDHQKSVFYAKRSYEGVLKWAKISPLPGDEIQRLKTWLSSSNNRIDQKREDARKMLTAMQCLVEQTPGPKRVAWTFQNTDSWVQVKRSMPARSEVETGHMPSTFGAVIDELRIHPNEYAAMKREATSRQLHVRLSRVTDELPSDALVQETAAAFRRERGLLEASAVQDWLEQQLLSEAAFERLMMDETGIAKVTRLLSGNIEGFMRDALRCAGRYGALARRADQKHSFETSGAYGTLMGMSPDNSDEALLTWFFEKHLHEDRPTNMAAYIRQLDISSMERFLSMIRREYLFQRFESRETDDTPNEKADVE